MGDAYQCDRCGETFVGSAVSLVWFELTDDDTRETRPHPLAKGKRPGELCSDCTGDVERVLGVDGGDAE